MPSIQTSNVGTNSINGDSTIDKQLTCCCLPNGACLKIDSLIALNGASECVRVLCSNENCSAGQYMHRECFESWEQNVLTSLKSVGRARLWSDRQRLQNLWTKKGYELVYKVCGCKCGRGHIRKDLEWSDSFAFESAQQSKNSHFANSGSSMGGQRTRNSGVGDDSEAHNRKKKRSRNNQKPAVSLTLMNPSGYHPNSQQQNMHQQLHMYHQQIHQNGHNTVEFTQDDSAVSNNNNANGVGGNTQLSTGDDNSSNNNSNIVDLSPNKNVGVIGSGLHGQNQLQIQQQNPNFNNSVANKSISTGQIVNALGLDICVRSSSLSCSDSGSNSPTASHSSDASVSPIQHRQKEQILQLHQQYHTFGKNILSGINSCPTGGPNLDQQMMASVKLEQQQQQNDAIFSRTKNMSCAEQQQLVQQQKNKEVEIYSERVRSTSGCNGIFSRRLDFSSFNLLPKTRLNSYQVKIEDEGNHGNDETRLFILSSLAQSQMSRVVCILCEDPMLVFDRYPLVDGSFFLSPKQHSASCIEVKYDGRALFLTCVCMACLDGTAVNRVVNCRFCGETWDGSNLVLGTMYSYDIFAAMPCCAERLKCNNCFKLLLHPQQRLNFYSDYSHCVTCPYCATQDTHFVKPLNYCFTKSAMVRHKLIA